MITQGSYGSGGGGGSSYSWNGGNSGFDWARMGGYASQALSGFANQDENMELMDYDEAYNKAWEVMQPQMQRAKKKAKSNINQDQVNRGFYGQGVSDVVRNRAMADIQGQYEGQTAQYAGQILNNQYRRAEAQQQMQQQQDQGGGLWSGIGGIAGTIVGGPVGGTIGSFLGGLFD